MKKIIETIRKKTFPVALAISAAVAGFLWIKSDLPPYSYPADEISSFSWGLIIDGAHKWRNWDFSFWDRAIGGGCSLFQVGQYPLLNPFNFMAWFLNDDRFFLFTLILPYAVSVFFCCLIFRDEFKMKWVYSIFGALCYSGLSLSRHMFIATYTQTLWGPLVFPATVYAYLKLKNKGSMLFPAAIGGVIAFQFAASGVTSLPQVFIWWLLFILIEFLSACRSEGFRLSQFKFWLLNSLILTVVTFGLFGIQFVPTFFYWLRESARVAGYYPVNNFPLFGLGLRDSSLEEVIYRAYIQGGSMSAKGIFGLWIAAFALAVHSSRQVFSRKGKSFLLLIWMTTTVYFLIPQLAGWFTTQIPATANLFSVITRFTFRYGIYVLDFCIVLTFCLILNNEELRIVGYPSRQKNPLSFVLFSLAIAVITIPALLTIPKLGNSLLHLHQIFDKFTTTNPHVAQLLFFIGLIILLHLAFRPKKRIYRLLFTIAFLALGLMTTIHCFNWSNKGKRTSFPEYKFSSPEMKYYRTAKGKYFLPYDEPLLMSHNFNLLYGVHGTGGILSVPPYRFDKFMAAYHNNAYKETKYWTGYKYFIKNPTEPIASYFPVEFTTTRHGNKLPWKDFSLKVAGEDHDIWVRNEEVPRVRFANTLQCTNFETVMKQLEDVPLKDSTFVVDEDCHDFDLKPSTLSPKTSNHQATYSNFEQPKGDFFKFNISSPKDTFVILPEMYQRGWHLAANGKSIKLFPAYYLFLGFYLPAGNYQLQLRFIPPHLFSGLIASIGTMALLIYLIRKTRAEKT